MNITIKELGEPIELEDYLEEYKFQVIFLLKNMTFIDCKDNLIQKIDKNLAELQKEVTKENEEKQSTLSLSDQLEEFEDKAKYLNEQRDKEKLINKLRQPKEQKDVSTL